MWFSYVGYTLIFATLLLKSLRLYWVFSRRYFDNAGVSFLCVCLFKLVCDQLPANCFIHDFVQLFMKTVFCFQAKSLSDKALLCGIVALSMVTIGILSVWSIKEEWRYKFVHDLLPFDGFASSVRLIYQQSITGALRRFSISFPICSISVPYAIGMHT